jgi:hypothetical protein
MATKNNQKNMFHVFSERFRPLVKQMSPDLNAKEVTQRLVKLFEAWKHCVSKWGELETLLVDRIEATIPLKFILSVSGRPVEETTLRTTPGRLCLLLGQPQSSPDYWGTLMESSW